MLIEGDIAAVKRKIQGGICLAVFTITVGKFADEMGFVPTLGPGLSQIETDGSR